jgi:uncharacterized Zn-binding protein involved in type VI secretion
MAAVATKGDKTFSNGLFVTLPPAAAGKIAPPAGRRVFVNDQPIAAVGDDVTPLAPGPALSSVDGGSAVVRVGGKRVARKGDTTTTLGWILTGFSRVDIGR